MTMYSEPNGQASCLRSKSGFVNSTNSSMGPCEFHMILIEKSAMLLWHNPFASDFWGGWQMETGNANPVMPFMLSSAPSSPHVGPFQPVTFSKPWPVFPC